MSRPLRGQEVIDKALQAIATATTVEQLRQAQAVYLTVEIRHKLGRNSTSYRVV